MILLAIGCMSTDGGACKISHPVVIPIYMGLAHARPIIPPDRGTNYFTAETSWTWLHQYTSAEKSGILDLNSQYSKLILGRSRGMFMGTCWAVVFVQS